MRVTRRPGLVLATCLLLSGCWGPYFRPAELALSPIEAEAPVKRVVVVGFAEAFELQWKTVSTQRVDKNWVKEVTTFHRSNSVRDISNEIAEALRQEGVPAVGSTEEAPVTIEPGDLVARGLIDTHKGWDPCFLTAGDVIQVGFSFATLGMYGLFLPYFYPVAIGTEVDVTVEVYDHTTKHVLLAREQRFDVYNESLHLIGWSISDTEDALVRLRATVARGLARALGPRRAGVK